MSTRVDPIFIAGMNRSGTTLLGNVLCRFPQIVSAQHEKHYGIHESCILTQAQYWGDISEDRQLDRLMNEYTRGDMFKLLDGEAAYFRANRPDSFYDFFLTLMDQFTERREVPYWTTKLDPRFWHYPQELERFVSLVNTRYSDPRFIGIQRDWEDVLRSAMKIRERDDLGSPSHSFIRRRLSGVMETVRCCVEQPAIQHLVDSQDGLVISFSDLVEDQEATIRHICDWLGTEYMPELLERRYAPNTSFSGSSRKQVGIGRFELLFLRGVVKPLFDLLPAGAGRWLQRMNLNLRRQSPPTYHKLSSEPRGGS